MLISMMLPSSSSSSHVAGECADSGTDIFLFFWFFFFFFFAVELDFDNRVDDDDDDEEEEEEEEEGLYWVNDGSQMTSMN